MRPMMGAGVGLGLVVGLAGLLTATTPTPAAACSYLCPVDGREGELLEAVLLEGDDDAPTPELAEVIMLQVGYDGRPYAADSETRTFRVVSGGR